MTKHPDHVPFGLWVYIMSDCVLFAGLFAAYAVLHTETAGSVSPTDIFDRSFVFMETIVLLLSSFTCGLAVLAGHRKNTMGVWAGLLATFLLGLTFLGMELYEFHHLWSEGTTWQTSAFLSSFFTLVGTHGLHIFFGLIWILALFLHLLIRGRTEGTNRGVLYFSLFWHFLDIVWICIFSLVYLFGLLSL